MVQGEGRNWHKLLECTSSRSFLSAALKLQYRERGAPNLSDFSRRAGFRSRSTLSELIRGKKGWSVQGFRKIERALKLPKPYKRLLGLFVHRENPDLRLLRVHKVEEEIARLQAELATDDKSPLPSIEPAVVSKPKIFLVYAALGSVERGADLGQIQSRTRLTRHEIHRALSSLVAAKMVRVEGKRFFAIKSQGDVLGLNTDSGLETLIREVVREIDRNRRRLVAEKKALSLYSAFSLRRGDVFKFKERLRAAVLDVMDEFQVDEGDLVEQVFISALPVDVF